MSALIKSVSKAINELKAQLATSAGATGISTLNNQGQSVTVADYLKQAESISKSAKASDRAPAYLEQNITGFFARGMLTSEAENVGTEQAITANKAAGAVDLDITDSTQYQLGGTLTVKHDNGKYSTYFIASKTGNKLGIKPALKSACTVGNARVERTWYNRAHPGKFYMRELAQRIANTSEIDAAMPSGARVLFTNVASNPNTTEDTIAAIGGTSVNYFPQSHLGSSANTNTPARFTLARSAFVDNIDAIGDGAETALFDTLGIGDAVVKVAMFAEGGGHTYAIQAINQTGLVIAEKVIGVDGVTQIYTMGASLRGHEKVKIRVVVKTYGGAGGVFALSQIDVFEAHASGQKIIQNESAKIVVLGDSWVAGDPGAPVERAALTVHLQKELPRATLINAGLGGNKVWEMLARFDTDVAPHKPDGVIVVTGTNEAYNPSSGIFFPNAVEDFLRVYGVLIGKILEIGARPIIVGVPALAQTDPAVPGFPEWQLNDRAQMYSRYFFEWQGKRPVIKQGSNANGTWTIIDDETMVCTHSVAVSTVAANTLATSLWTYPRKFAAAPKVNVTPVNYDSAQIVVAGGNAKTDTSINVRMMSSAGAFAATVDCVAVGRWK